MSYFVVSISVILFSFAYLFSRGSLSGHSVPTITLLDSGEKKKPMNEMGVFRKVIVTRKPDTDKL